MGKLDNNSMIKDLSLELLDKYPVWTWDESEEYLNPVLDYKPLPDEPNLFIKAKFETPKGKIFDGYLIGDEQFYAFGLFHENKEFIFNLNLLDMAQNSLNEIFRFKKADLSFLFPLRFHSELFYKDKKTINGVFDPDI